MPPTETTKTYPRRQQLEAIGGVKSVQTPLTIKVGTKVRRGHVLGVVAATGYGRERTRTTAAGAGFADNSAIGQVVDGSLFKADDELTLEDGTAIGTVASVDTTTTPDTVTLDANAAVNVAAGDAVLGSDGSQVAQGIADEEVASAEAADTTLSPIIGGYLDKSLIIGLDESAIKELGGAVVLGNIFKF